MARPNEIKVVRAYLENGVDLPRGVNKKTGEPETDDEYHERLLNEGAKAIINAVDEARQDRTDYLVVRQAGRLAQAFGPYATYAQVVKAIEGGKIPALDGSRFFCVPLYHPSAADRAMEKANEGGISDEAKAIWEIARNGGSQPNRKRGRAA